MNKISPNIELFEFSENNEKIKINEDTMLELNKTIWKVSNPPPHQFRIIGLFYKNKFIQSVGIVCDKKGNFIEDMDINIEFILRFLKKMTKED